MGDLLPELGSGFQRGPNSPQLPTGHIPFQPQGPYRPRRNRGGRRGRGSGLFETMGGRNRRRTMALGLAVIAALGVSQRDTLAGMVKGECPAGYAWSNLGPAPIKPECKVGLPRPIKSEVEWPGGITGVAEYQVVNIATKVKNPADDKEYTAVVVETTFDEEKAGQLFEEPDKITNLPNYAKTIAAHIGTEACAAEMGRIIRWGQSGADSLTTDALLAQQLRDGENHYAIQGNGGTATDNPEATNILVAIRSQGEAPAGSTPTTAAPASGEQELKIIACV